MIKNLLNSKSAYYGDFWRIMWHWSNDAKEFSFEITGLNYILKYIQIEKLF